MRGIHWPTVPADNWGYEVSDLVAGSPPMIVSLRIFIVVFGRESGGIDLFRIDDAG
jgi:hypothetical protein